MEAIVGAILGVMFAAGGFWAGWSVRDRLRSDDEPHLQLVEKPLPEPRAIPIAGRHVEKR